ncbi:ecto-ADP-ribosyltransferase 4-like [Diretmus argenteus]
MTNFDPVVMYRSTEVLSIRRSNVRLPAANHSIPMGMVEDAVDDMYKGCTATMMDMVKKKYLIKESKGQFLQAWQKAETCAEDRLEKRRKVDGALTKDHLRAICVYTSNDIYQKFNRVVRTSRAEYSNFKFHSLHFLLTDAIQILKSGQEYCSTTYRRTGGDFSGDINQIIRFGSFASSSFRKDLKIFGKKTCFEIETCLGAYLKDYSWFGDKEQEVVIPPYEMFKIIKITRGPQLKLKIGLEDCEVVYDLESVGIHSNLNCKAAAI